MEIVAAFFNESADIFFVEYIFGGLQLTWWRGVSWNRDKVTNNQVDRQVLERVEASFAIPLFELKGPLRQL